MNGASPLFVGLLSFVLALVLGPLAIRVLTRLRLGQSVREDGPKSHLKKQGTPSMGGVIMLLALCLSLVVSGSLKGHIPMALFAVLGFGVIGFLDDLLNVRKKKSLGLKARHKLLAQIAIAGTVALYALTHETLGPYVLIPFRGEILALSPFVYLFLIVLVLVGAANGVNMTDGLDGLATGTTAIAAAFYGIIAYSLGYYDMVFFSAGLVGACLGFAWYNFSPALVFMGDTGSLSLGMALGVIAVFTRTPLLLPLVGGVFVLETVSVIIQVLYFKWSKGKRVFRMAPVHHHFELGGLAEQKVVIRFWLAGLFFATLGLLAILW